MDSPIPALGSRTLVEDMGAILNPFKQTMSLVTLGIFDVPLHLQCKAIWRVLLTSGRTMGFHMSKIGLMLPTVNWFFQHFSRQLKNPQGNLPKI